MDSMALFSVALPVMTIASYLPPSSFKNSIPSMPGIFISVITSSKLSSSFFSASFGLLNVSISNSLYSARAISRDLRIFISSSTIAIFKLAPIKNIDVAHF